jgi:hypothetical protein
MSTAILSGIFGKAESPIHNALIESFAVHVRVLAEFFYPRRPEQDTILAEHFFQGRGEWERVRPAESDTLKRARDLANKLLAHLTYTRSKDHMGGGWQVVGIVGDLESTLAVFLRNIPEESLGSRWRVDP